MIRNHSTFKRRSHTRALAALLGIGMAGTLPASAGSTLPSRIPRAIAGGYTLVWHDEFDRDGRPDPARWNYEKGFVRNHEPQWYQPDNAVVRNGVLVIEAKKATGDGRVIQPTASDDKSIPAEVKYTSASLITKDRFAFRYGKVIMRAKIDTRQGMWPAFWMLGTDRGPVKWPACGEVDIMEFYRNTLLGNLFWDGGMLDTHIPLRSLGDPTWSAHFHVWELTWDERHMAISVDHRLVNDFDLSKTVNRGTGINPFHQKMYLVVNLALGQHHEPIPEQNLPGKFEVDYVRIYQRPDRHE